MAILRDPAPTALKKNLKYHTENSLRDCEKYAYIFLTIADTSVLEGGIECVTLESCA